VTVGLAREYARPKRWLWAEAGWGSVHLAGQPFHLDRDLAALLCGMDHCQGALLWQGKNNEGSGVGVFTEQGEKAKGYDLLRAVADVVQANAAFFAEDHPRLNADGFPVAEESFREDDPAVLTRLLPHHLIIFSEAPVTAAVTFTDTQGRTLREVPTGHGYSQPWPLDVQVHKEDRDRVSTSHRIGRLRRAKAGSRSFTGPTITVSRIRPRVLYLLERQAEKEGR
jgi:hypothetical protein